MARPSGQDFPKHKGELLEILNSLTLRTSKMSKMARPSGQDFPKHKGELFGEFGNFGNPER